MGRRSRFSSHSERRGAEVHPSLSLIGCHFTQTRPSASPRRPLDELAQDAKVKEAGTKSPGNPSEAVIGCLQIPPKLPAQTLTNSLTNPSLTLSSHKLLHKHLHAIPHILLDHQPFLPAHHFPSSTEKPTINHHQFTVLRPNIVITSNRAGNHIHHGCSRELLGPGRPSGYAKPRRRDQDHDGPRQGPGLDGGRGLLQGYACPHAGEIPLVARPSPCRE